MSERVATLDEASTAFTTLAEAEGSRIPTYARICRIIAEDPDLHGLLLEAPTGQRLPVLLLAAIHDTVLAHPESPLAPWYPSVTGTAPSTGDPGDALRRTIESHRDRILALLRHRQVQTNEVNRCCAWWLALAELTSGDHRPVHLVELGASAGLNLRLDDYAYELVDPSAPTDRHAVGRVGSPVRLASELRGAPDPGRDPFRRHSSLGAPIVSRVGLDQRPLDVTDADDARWLEACVWPEQIVRFERLTAALALAAQDPPRVVAGDLVDDLAPLIDAAPADAHVVVLSSWVLAYVPRARRSQLASLLVALAGDLAARGTRLTLLTLESDNAVPWLPAPSVAADASADERFASVLAVTSFAHDEEAGKPALSVSALARCQAHLAWVAPL